MGRVLLALVSTLCLVTQVLAGAWTPNNFFYKPAIGARGDDEKVKFDSGLNRVDSRLGNEKWLTDTAYNGDLATAVTSIGSAKAILSIPAGNWPVATNLAIPANLTLRISHGALLNIATGKTLTINGPLEAGLYQIFSCTGTGSVAGLKTTQAIWFGLHDDGSTDDYAAVMQSYNATATGGRLIFPRPAVGLALSNTLAITKPIIIEFQGDAYVTDIYWAATSIPIFKWIGGASPMISVTNVAGVFFKGDALLDANRTATFGIYADRMRFGGWKGNLVVWNPATAGIKLYSSSSIANDNSMYNTFDHIVVRGPQALVMDSAYPLLANCCHNLVNKLTVVFTGDNALDLISCDNNSFNEVFLYRHTTEGLTTGNGLRFGSYACSNQISHYQGPVYLGAGTSNGTGTCLVDVPAVVSSVNTILNYDMTNGQALPNITDKSIRSATYKWTLSGSGTNEYYLELAAGGNPGLVNKPFQVVANAAKVNYNAIGALSAGEWGYGNNDTLGYNTVYIRLADGTDPDTKTAGYVSARFSNLAYISNTSKSYGTYIPQFWMGGDVLHTTIGGEWTEYYDFTTGNGFRFKLNPDTRRLEIWKADSGTYAKIMELSQLGVHISATSLTLDTAGKGIVMTNAAGTVTKRVRLNDAGDGLILESP